MSKKTVAKLAGIVGAIPVLLIGTGGAAFADSQVTWHDKSTGRCLVTWTTVGKEGQVNTIPQCFDPFGKTNSDWYDGQSNLQDPNGAWTEKNHDGQCLTAYQGQVYVENCSSPANYYEQWYEKGLGNGNWQLVNRMSGWCLDSNAGGDVYTLPCNGGQYQVWR